MTRMNDTLATLDSVYQMRQSGATLEQIARHFGITWQRVKKLLFEHYGSTHIHGFLTVTELARLTGCSRDYVIKLKRRGIIQPVKIGRKNRLWKPETIATIIIYRDKHPPRCRVCHGSLPPRNSVFCSEACRIEGQRFKYRPEAVKKRHMERMRKWRKAHPEQVRELQRRAYRRQLAKKSLQR